MLKSLQKGFTLIELMIVVAIIGILAAIAIPAYQDYLIRSQVSEGLTMAAAAKAGVSEFYANKGTWPTSNSEAGMGAASDDPGQVRLEHRSRRAAASRSPTATKPTRQAGQRDGRPRAGRQRQRRRDLEVRHGRRPRAAGARTRPAAPTSTSLEASTCRRAAVNAVDCVPQPVGSRKSIEEPPRCGGSFLWLGGAGCTADRSPASFGAECARQSPNVLLPALWTASHNPGARSGHNLPRDFTFASLALVHLPSAGYPAGARLSP